LKQLRGHAGQTQMAIHLCLLVFLHSRKPASCTTRPDLLSSATV
jgi:hypothetical protein